MNKRIKDLGDGVISEAFSEKIQVNWNPINDESGITFDSARFLKVGENYISRIEGDTGVYISGADLHDRSFEINGRTITGVDMDIFVRMLYDQLYNEQIPDEEEETPESDPEEQDPEDPPEEPEDP